MKYLILCTLSLLTLNLVGFAEYGNSHLPLKSHFVQHESQNDTIKSRITPGIPSKFDWLKLLDGRELEVEVRRISDKYVFFSKPGNMDMDWIDRREVQTIYYRTGKIEQMTQKAVEIREVKDWQKVNVTHSKEDVNDMIKIEDLQVKHTASNRHEYYKAKTLEASAEIILKKQAALLNADIILIVKVDHYRAYGDPPVVTMTAEAYRKKE